MRASLYFFAVSFHRSLLLSDCWNLLADAHAKTPEALAMYPDCTPDMLGMSYRAPLILREVLDLDADILAVQECNP